MVLYGLFSTIGLYKFMNFEPTTPFILFGYFDILLLLLILFSGFVILKFNIIDKVNWKVNLIRYLILFFLCPYYSCKVEMNNVDRTFEMVDGFNVLYVLLRIPTWWVFGVILISVFDIYHKRGVEAKNWFQFTCHPILKRINILSSMQISLRKFLCSTMCWISMVKIQIQFDWLKSSKIYFDKTKFTFWLT